MTKKDVIQANIKFVGDLSNYIYHELRKLKPILNDILLDLFNCDERKEIQKELFNRLNDIGLATKDKRYYSKDDLINYITIYYNTLVKFI